MWNSFSARKEANDVTLGRKVFIATSSTALVPRLFLLIEYLARKWVCLSAIAGVVVTTN